MAALSLDPALKVAPHVILLQKSLGGVSGEGPLRSVQLICSSHVIRSSVGQVQTQNARCNCKDHFNVSLPSNADWDVVQKAGLV